jgi:23S rRNA (cytosine1962-C5)-methyltransferase
VSGRRRLAVRVTKDAERQIRGGHPWLFDGSITSVSPDGGEPGDLAVVFDAKRRFLAVGLYDPTSPIRVRILHHGAPATIDSTWLLGEMLGALERRRPLVEDGATTAYRVVHGENDGLPGLVLDRYDQVAVLKLYASSWLAHLDELVEVVDGLLAPASIVLRLARNVESGSLGDGALLAGEAIDGPVRYRENDLVFEADVVAGQKTGAFLDQRENRQRVRELAAGRRVLDVFACTGGFSVHAAAGGATAVHSVDLSPGAIATTRRNMALNTARSPVRACGHTTVVAEAQQEMRRLVDRGERFDLVVVDPPSFAQRGDQRRRAIRAYERLAELAAGLTEPGGIAVLASCSSRVSADEHLDAVERGMRRRGRTLVAPVRTGHPLDHPIGFPEGAYLKAVLARVEPAGTLRGRGSPGRTGSR